MTFLPLLLLAASSTHSAAVNGSWDLQAGKITIFRFVVDHARQGEHAAWIHPEHFDSDGESYSHIRGAPIREEARTARLIDGDLELGFPSSDSASPPMTIRLHAIDAGHLEAVINGSGLDPLELVRSSDPRSLNPWDATATYVPTVTRVTNPEMTAIFDADQADRALSKIDWSIVGPADRKRRERTSQLLDSGALQSADDYYHAAFVFQHGATPDDFLKAHILAIVAIGRGKSAADWIAAATLDRYLQNIGRPQVLGTQFKMPDAAPVTQEPYNRGLISDALRKALNVPPLAAQAEQRKEFEAQPKN